MSLKSLKTPPPRFGFSVSPFGLPHTMLLRKRANKSSARLDIRKSCAIRRISGFYALTAVQFDGLHGDFVVDNDCVHTMVDTRKSLGNSKFQVPYPLI